MTKFNPSELAENHVFADLFGNLEEELETVIRNMEVSERISLSKSEDLPECVYEVLKNDPNEEVKKALRKNKRCMVAA